MRKGAVGDSDRVEPANRLIATVGRQQTYAEFKQNLSSG
jgi:hypothetical protein